MAKSGTYTIDVHCAKCKTLLYRYRKEGGGELMKCYADMILDDYTEGDLKCPSCGQEFARPKSYHNRPAYKIIRGKVYVRGHHG